MSEQTPTPQAYHDDEIDLRKLFQAIGNFFVGIGHGIINMVLAFRRATFRYKFLLMGAIGIGLVTGVAYNKLTKPYYQTSLLLKSQYLNARLVENSIDKLNLLCEEKERKGLAKILNISNEVAQNIVSFDYEPFVDENDVVEIELLKQRLEELKIDKKDIQKIVKQIEIENRNTFQISVRVFETGIVENLQEALVGFFKNNPYVANRIRTNKERQQQLIAKLTQDLSLLDSLKNAYNLNLKLQASKPRDASTSVIFGESGVVNPVSVYNQSVSLFNLLQSTKRALALGSDFEVVDGFTTFSKPESPSLVKAAVYSMGLWLLLAYGLIVLIEINNYLNRIEEKGFAS